MAINTGTRKHDPLPLLQEFLATDLSSLMVDHRQRTVEAISEVAFDLGKNLLWIGIPESRTSTVAKELYRWTKPDVPRVHPYHFTKNFNPSQIAAHLEESAYNFAIKQYADLSL
jgi:hypothetical protein